VKFESTPIAIVGIGCRFPKAKDADGFWNNLVQGKVAFSKVPADRWNHEIFYSANQRDIDKAYVESGAFIDEYREFAALHYGIAPRRLEVMDPQQRLLIEATRWAIQDAGYETKSFDRSRTGIYVGLSTSEFQQLTQMRLHAMRLASGELGAGVGSKALFDLLIDMTSNLAPIRAFTLPGSLTALNAAAIAQTFDLGGPAYTIDSACASASVAIHDAVLQLRVGAVDTALAGGAYLNLSPGNFVAFTKIGAMSPSGICRPFDHRSDGFVQGDGVGLLFLKRLEDALEAGDRIHAVIRGSGCNNDGRGEGPMTPRVPGQLAALKAAYRDAGCSPATVAYFEAHGTATSTGDPVEIEALGTLLLDAGVPLDRPAYLGSVKANIGHTMSAAGIAGLVKAVKALSHQTVPPQPGFETPNPELHLSQFPLQVPTEPKPLLPRDGAPLRVGVSSFGFGGTNSHLVLEAPPVVRRSVKVARPIRSASQVDSADQPRPEAVLLTAPELHLLGQFARAVRLSIEEGPAGEASLADLAYTLNARRKHERYRAVLAARTADELLAGLRAVEAAVAGTSALPIQVSPQVSIYDSGDAESARARIAFMYPGQGAQRLGLMADALERYAGLKAAFDRVSGGAEGVLPRPLSTYLYPEGGDRAAHEEALKATEVCQPAMAALGLATAEFLAQAGVQPDLSLGHSLGEFPALSGAGALPAERAVRLVAERGQAMRDLGLDDPGTMAAVMADARTVAEVLADVPGVVIANFNHPRQVSISGTTAGVAQATLQLRGRGLEVKPLEVSHAFHSPLLNGVDATMTQKVGELPLSAPRHPVISGVADLIHGEDLAETKAVLGRHATSPVDFVRALERARDLGATIFVQMAGGNVLTGLARATLGAAGITLVNLATQDDDGGYELLRGLCVLAAHRAPVDFEVLYAGEGRRPVTLPETPLVRQEYWPVKDTAQPKPELTAAPKLSPGARVLDLPTAGPAVAAAPAQAPGLVELFAQQAALLASHAEIIAQQNRLLMGGAALPQAPSAERLQQLLAEPTPAPTRAIPIASQPANVSAPAVTAPAAPTPTAPVVDVVEVKEKVLQVVAKVSAFPREALKNEQRLVEELGFDSLMVADLSGSLLGTYPNLGALPPTLFNTSTTVGDLADHVTRTLQKGQAAPAQELKELPASRYRVRPVERKRPELGGRPVAGETWLLTEDGSPLAAALAQALEAKGAKLVRVRFTHDAVAAPARLGFGTLNLWPMSWVEGLPGALKTAGINLDGLLHAACLGLGVDRPFTEALSLLHPLAAALNVPRLYNLTALGGRLGLVPHAALSRNHLQAGLTGYTKALAREREGVVRTLDLDPGLDPNKAAAFVIEELEGGDLSPEVGFDGRRWVPELTLSPGGAKVRSLGAEDIVLITGGTGELGRLVADEVAARRPKAVLLLGRRPTDAKIEAQLKALAQKGTAARYLAAEVSDPAALARALAPAQQELGPVTVVFHAAGLIEDASVNKKSWESVQRVVAPKVRGLQAILQVLSGLKDLVLFSSWAGRFGNAGQSDYSAANEWLDRVAVLGQGAGRVVSIVWPPWASTAMVRSIPDPIRRAMKAEGVTFLGDEEGRRLLNGIFESGSSGLELVGRNLPVRRSAALVEERWDDRHEYLADHQLKGKKVVPLASVADAFAAAFLELSPRGDGAPLVLSDLELIRGVMGGDTTQLRLWGRAEADGTEAATLELKAQSPGGQPVTAYRGRAGYEPTLARQAPTLTGQPEALELPLEEFYARHTFHGPRFRGIQRITSMTAQGITGEVHGAQATEWLPERSHFAIDPLALDSAFQLAGYWLQCHLKKAGFPIGFEQLVLYRPLQGNLQVTVTLGEIGAEEFGGDLYLSDAEGRPVAFVRGLRGRFAEGLSAEASPNGGNAPAAMSIPEEHYKIAAFPEYESLDQRFQMAELIGLRNPYFHVHAGTARDTSVVEGKELIHFSGYNYLGFSGHPEVVKAAQDAIARYGTSVSASRVASGERPVHRELEAGIAAHVGVDDSLVFVSGHATNVTTVGHLFDKNDLVLHDSLIHDSVFQGIKLSGAARRPFPHNDLVALERLLGQIRPHYRRCLIVVEGIYSMDGDLCDLPQLIELKKRYKTLLMVDEAHSAGVLGPKGEGLGHHFPGIDPRDVDIWMGTLSKSFASCGGYIAGSKELIRYLKFTAPGFVYSAGITPPNAAAALKSLELMRAHPEVVERLRSRSRFFLELAKSKGLNCGHAIGAAVLPVIVGNSMDCLKLSEALAKKGINVQPIVYPAVEDDGARLRFFISALHSEEQLRYTVETTARELELIRQAHQAEAAQSL
jgi:8-amino-7-oxononanoate synthase